MKTYILLLLLAAISCAHLLGNCGMAPKYRPISCYEDTVLPEDIPELKELLEKFKNGGDDNEFANYLGDMVDKKAVRESNGEKNDDLNNQPIGACGMHPKYLPFKCYEPNVLRRDRNTLADAYDRLHGSDLTAFNKVYQQLEDKKYEYFYGSSK